MATLETPDLLDTDPDPEIDEGPYYSVDEFAKLFGVHPQTVRKWLKGGDIPAVRIGSTWRISASVLRAHSTPAAKQAS